MSATNRGTERQPLDQYFTPPAIAEALVGLLPLGPNALVLEPHVGRGAYAKACVDRGAAVVALDLDPNAEGLKLPGLGDAAGGIDFLTVDPKDLPGFDWIVGNPPYSRPTGRVGKSGKPITEECAIEHIRHALRFLKPTGILAFLLRLNLLGSGGDERAEFWRTNGLAHIHVLTRRPSFTGGGTDACEYGWFVFARQTQHRPELSWFTPPKVSRG